MAEHVLEGTATATFNTQKKFVRLTRIRNDGFVEFEFAIGDPGLALELIMPAHAYRAFCQANQVAFLPAVDTDDQHLLNITGPLQVMARTDSRLVPRAFTSPVNYSKGDY